MESLKVWEASWLKNWQCPSLRVLSISPSSQCIGIGMPIDESRELIKFISFSPFLLHTLELMISSSCSSYDRMHAADGTIAIAENWPIVSSSTIRTSHYYQYCFT
jgi:hypothetical protein